MAIVRGPLTEDFWHIQFGDELADGEMLTGVPVVTGPADLTFEDISIQDEEGGKGQSVVRVRVTGAQHGKSYPVTAQCGTSTPNRQIAGTFAYTCMTSA